MRGIIPAIDPRGDRSAGRRPVCQLFDFFAGTSTGGMLRGRPWPPRLPCLG